jgi:FkbM family methyltransferase
MGDFQRRAKETVRRMLPLGVRPHRIRLGALKGARIYTSWHDYPGAILGTTERPLLEWFRNNTGLGETWIDVGAHYGYTALALSRLVGSSGRVFAFEPVLSTVGCIGRTRELNGLEQMTVVPMGLNSCPNVETLELPTIRGMADSTIERREWSERILAVSLDSLWPSLSGDDPEIHGIKIDVQGMEFDVLCGMRDVLRQWSPKIVVEFHHGVNRVQVLQVLKDCGYETHRHPIDASAPPDVFADDMSYVFQTASSSCASSSTASSTARS